MKKFKSVLSLLLALMMVFSCFAAFAAEGDGDVEREIVTSFSDVDPSTVMGKAIGDLAMLGIVTGYPDGTFGPNDNITRAEFATICVRLADLADGLGADAVTGFPDLDSDDTFSWARPYILMAKQTGMINGYSDGNFGAGDPVTYEQVIAVLMRMRGWGKTCDAVAKENPEASWSIGYIQYANSEGLTKNAMTTNITQATTRGTVAILANNSRSVRELVEIVTPEGDIVIQPKDKDEPKKDDNIISGVVTATYLAYIDEPRSKVSKNEIMVDNKRYTLSDRALDSVDMYDILGKSVRMLYDEREDQVSSITVSKYNSTEIYSGYVGKNSKFFLGVENGRIQYSSNLETFRTNNISLPDTVVYNGKVVEDFYAEDLVDENSPYFFKNGVIEIVSTGKYNFAKISNYDTYVVNSTSTTNQTDYIRFMYKTGSDYRMEFPNENEADYFVFRRGNTNINGRNDLKKFDVLSILRSPEDADEYSNYSVMIIEVSRNSVTNQRVTSINENDATLFEMNDQYYQYNYDYKNVPDNSTDEVPELKRGSTGVNIYLDHLGLIAAVSTSGSTTGEGSFAYGYLMGLRQNDRDSDYDLEFYILDADGKAHEIGTGNSIQIDGKRYNTSNNNILDLLKDTAEMAASSYMNVRGGRDLEGLMYQQPIRYKQNTSTKLITALDTVAESSLGDDLVLSASIDDGSTDSEGRRTYNRSSGFPYYDEDGNDKYFTLSSDTKIIFVPDNRTDFDSYHKMTTSNFTAGNKYYVEAYNIGTTRANRADLVFVYKTNDSMMFNHTTPFLIVTDYGSNDDEEETITGYRGVYNSGVSTTPNTTITLNYSKLSSEARHIYNNLGRGDIIRYIVGSDGKVSDIELWLDASDPFQEESVSSQDEAVENRVLAIRSNSSDPVDGDAYNAAFRLAYGTVLRHDNDLQIITVSPTLDVDYDDYGLEMAEGGNGVVAHMYGSNTRVFIYNGRSGVSYVSGTDAFEMIDSYEDVQEGASVVVTFSTGDSTNSASPFRMIYIIR